MPNQRAPGRVVSSYSAPAELVAAAKARATETGTSVSVVIRDALERFIAPPPRQGDDGANRSREDRP